MTLSVLMSVYKNEKSEFLDRCFISIWDKQTRKPDQIVIVEDGPLTTQLYHCLDIWQENIPTVLLRVKNDTNEGLTVSLNKGLDYVTSDLVARMDSDDISASDRFEKQEKYLTDHADIYVLGGSIQEFDDNHDCLSVRKYPTSNIRKYISKGAPVCHATTMMRMEMFRDGGLRYNERYRTAQDSALWFQVLKAGYKISNIDTITYYVYVTEGMIKRRSKKAKTEFEIFTKGIFSLYGLFTWRYMYPISRYLMRMLPPSITKKIYKSKLRSKVMKG